MIVTCLECGSRFDDEYRWTICPHNPLEAGPINGYCRRHDLFEPCACCAAVAESKISARSAGMNIFMSISSSSTLLDIEALLDSYAVELCRNDKVLESGPLYMCWTAGGFQTAETTRPQIPVPEFDPTLTVRMIRYEPPVENQRPYFRPRWPFFVDQPLIVEFAVGYQWWRYHFTPGKLYEQRSQDSQEQPQSAAQRQVETLPAGEPK